MRTLWKLYYILKFGKSYGEKLTTSRNYNKIIDQSTETRISHFYNREGDKIRGWQKPLARFTKLSEQHPLELKYR